jgi:hypothetical protein
MVLLKSPAFKVAGSGQFELITPLVYQYGDEAIVVPAGFHTDFASIPRLVHPLIPVNGRHRLPAILHDFLYSAGIYSRKQSDIIFLRFMKEQGVRYTRRYAMYNALRMFGWLAWNGHRKNDI